MKVILSQSTILPDQPSINLNTISNVLKTVKMPDLVVFPRLIISGFLKAEIFERPSFVAQYQKAWEDFINISLSYPEIAIATSRYRIDDNFSEETIIVKNGQIIFSQIHLMGQEQALPEKWPSIHYKDCNIRVLAGNDYKLPLACSDVDLLINLKNEQYQGDFKSPLNADGANKNGWFVNVSEVGISNNLIYQGATYVKGPDQKLKGWVDGFDNTMIEFDTNTSPKTITPPNYSRIEFLYKALISGIRGYVKNCGFEKVILGLSGGIDSAVMAVLAKDALGASNVLSVALPSGYNAPESLTDARALAKNLSIAFLTIPITKLHKTFLHSFALLPKNEPGLAEENIQPRIRATILMFLANSENRLLLSTSNKSELAVGYTTMYGDMAGALMPLGDVYKTDVYKLAEYINRKEEIIPRNTIERQPSAELKPNQKDEDSLLPYDILDDILKSYLENRQGGSQIAKNGHSPLNVAWTLSAIKKASFKRFQAPPVLVTSTCPLPR